MKTALVIMAAGIGSRFGGGIKQLASVDSDNHIIMDYSIHDAIAAGFNKIIFVIRRDIESDFRQVIGDRIEQLCRSCGVEVCYAFQELQDLPGGLPVPEGRTKPWGTGQAILAARQWVAEPFAVINADDYYGTAAFQKIHDYLVQEAQENRFCMAGFKLKNTLSDNGAVTRGICEVDSEGFLTKVTETAGVVKHVDPETGAVTAEIYGRQLDPEAFVSMNMWGLTPGFMDVLADGFWEFLNGQALFDPLKAEFLIPVFLGQLLHEQKVTIKLLETTDKWFGVTYKEDRELVVQSIQNLIAAGVYGEALYDDLPRVIHI